MKQIHTVVLDGLPINLMVDKNAIGYNFEFDGKQFGNRVDLKSKKQIDIISATALLLINALDTRNALNKLKQDGKDLN
jgi:hypothetical protein